MIVALPRLFSYLFFLKTVSEIFLKPCKNVKGHKITRRTYFIFDRVMAFA